MNRRDLMKLGGIALAVPGGVAQALPTAEGEGGVEVAAVSALRLHPGDVLVVTIPGPCTQDEYELAKEQIGDLMHDIGLGDVPTLVIARDVKIEVLRREA